MEDSQVIGIRDGERKTRWIADLEYAADAQFSQFRAIDDEFVHPVAVEFRGRLAQRGVFENQLTALPRGDPLDGGGILPLACLTVEAQSFAGIEQLQSRERFARQGVGP